jgi:hypothetical protein
VIITASGQKGKHFCYDAALGRQKIRFAYAKPLDILRTAEEWLMQLRA